MFTGKSFDNLKIEDLMDVRCNKQGSDEDLIEELTSKENELTNKIVDMDNDLIPCSGELEPTITTT